MQYACFKEMENRFKCPRLELSLVKQASALLLCVQLGFLGSIFIVNQPNSCYFSYFSVLKKKATVQPRCFICGLKRGCVLICVYPDAIYHDM